MYFIKTIYHLVFFIKFRNFIKIKNAKYEANKPQPKKTYKNIESTKASLKDI